ncbi:hypothetical protein D3C76_1435530 [compost metagenome]
MLGDGPREQRLPLQRFTDRPEDGGRGLKLMPTLPADLLDDAAQIDPRRIAIRLDHRIDDSRITRGRSDLFDLFRVRLVGGMSGAQLVLQGGRIATVDGSDSLGATGIVPRGMVERQVQWKNFALRALDAA